MTTRSLSLFKDLLWSLLVLGVMAGLFRLWYGLGATTNLSDEFYYESQFGNGLATNFSITRRPGWPRETMLTLKRRF